ncbi:hypothetical protein [Sphingobium sp.]|uniref:hypothetical protein n=1 Tax=Sphingobium TaxID=165695 RepID=UPI001A287FF8|nr:hypothetical protein [Sphingobium sp.]MBJ7375287.1 hypothetical protein [Sphingobium sp.]
MKSYITVRTNALRQQSAFVRRPYLFGHGGAVQREISGICRRRRRPPRRDVPNVPEWTFSIAGDYEKSIGSSTVRAHLDYAWQDDTALYAYRTLQTGDALTDNITNAVAKALTRPAGGELNGRAGVSFADETIEVALFGRNILNRRVDIAGLLFGAPLFAAMGKRNDPATYGVAATFKFGGF